MKQKSLFKSKSQKKNSQQIKISMPSDVSENEAKETLEISDMEASDMEDLEAELRSDDECDLNDDTIESDEDAEESVEKHIQSLAKLKENDPEFYKFLEENDKSLLNFNSLIEDEDMSDEQEENLHIPDENLAVASDESDLEVADGEIDEDSKVVTLKLLRKWQNEIRIDKSNRTLNNLAKAFHAALMRVSPGDSENGTCFRVDGSSIFNAVIQLCVLEFGPAVRRYLGISHKSKQPHKYKKFIKIKKTLKSYFEDLLKLLSGVASANIQTVLLKHLHYMSSMLTSFPHSTKSIIKRLIEIWGTGDEGVRVIAFFCILRITRNNQMCLLDMVLKTMYMTFVKNSKFVSTSTLPAINFMRRSLVEMFALDLNVAYQHVFLYIRQLAIHLRNAIMVNKKENTQAVYNWQYVNSLKLWGNLLSVTSNKPQLQQLIYPFVQVCLGTMRLVPTAQYYPLRFHITEVLMEVSRDTGVFIPLLPFIINILSSYDFNKKHQRVSMKPLQFTTLLRLSKSQLAENGFKEKLIDTIYSQLLEYMTQQSHTMAFPELSFMCRFQIKLFLKKCKNPNYQKKMKQIHEKIEQNAQFIENERKKATLNLGDSRLINGWESQIRNLGTPLSIYFESWAKVRHQKKRKEITNNDQLGDYNLPKLKKSKMISNEKKGPIELFPSDSEEEEEIGQNKKRGKRGGKHVKPRDHSGPVIDNGEDDALEDIDINDW